MCLWSGKAQKRPYRNSEEKMSIFCWFLCFICFYLFAQSLLFHPQGSPTVTEQQQALIRCIRLWRGETLLLWPDDLWSQKHEDNPHSFSTLLSSSHLTPEVNTVAGKKSRIGKLVRCPGRKVSGRRRMVRRLWRGKCSRRCFYKVVYEILLGLQTSCNMDGSDLKQHTKVFGNYSLEHITS